MIRLETLVGHGHALAPPGGQELTRFSPDSRSGLQICTKCGWAYTVGKPSGLVLPIARIGETLTAVEIQTREQDYCYCQAPLTDEEIVRLFGALRGLCFEKLSLQTARNIATMAGMVIVGLSADEAGHRAPVANAIDIAFSGLGAEARLTALRVMAQRLNGQNEDCARATSDLLGQHGFQYVNGQFVPVGLIDAREAKFLPESAVNDLSKATARLVDGDESGAISAACGAVDSVTAQIFAQLQLGEPTAESFAGRVRAASKQLGIYDQLEKDLVGRGMASEKAQRIVQNLQKGIGQVAEGIQILRSDMGDVHGTKPALRQITFVVLKAAALISGLLRPEH
jgi:hypothetical protein